MLINKNMKKIIKMILSFPLLIIVFLWYWLLLSWVYLFFLIRDSRLDAEYEFDKLKKCLDKFNE